MYLPKHFAESDPRALHALMRTHPLATLVTVGADGLGANHIPLHFEPRAGSHGRLIGHVPRANPLSASPDDTEVLAVFHGPDSYVSPNWYPTKKAHGKVVPTWNYAVVHAHGRLRVVDDPRWVRAQIEALTATQERRSAHPWQVADAPDDYVEQLIRILVGLDIEITRLVGKTKASQNQPEVNRVGVAEALRGTGRTNDADMAALIERCDPNSR